MQYRTRLAMYVSRNIEARSSNHCSSRKAILVVCVCVCVCVCVRAKPLLSSMQRACAILSSVACPPLQYFATSHAQLDSRKVTDHKMYFFTFSRTFARNTSHSKKN